MSDNPFRRAIMVLEKYGWTQETIGNATRGFCALGALEMARAPRHVAEVLADVVGATVEYREDSYPSHPVAAWNDAPERTYEDVLLAFKQAAEKWDGDPGLREEPRGGIVILTHGKLNISIVWPKGKS